MNRVSSICSVLLLSLFTALPVTAATVSEILFEGNRVTRERVMLREMAIAVGDPADPVRIAASRQAILDLGLFREVEISQEALAGDTVRLRVRVREKRYLLPIPRLDASVDRDYSYGVQVYWSNVGGRNHSMSAFVQEARFPEDRAAEASRGARVAYTAPYAFDTPYQLRGTLERIEQVTVRNGNGFDENFDRMEMLVSRDFSQGRPRRGWLFGGGLFLQRQGTAGLLAPPADGRATALVAQAEFRDLRFDVYSESGRRFNTRMEHARRGLMGSDYGYTQWTARHREYLPIGQRAHQRLHLTFEGGWRTGAPDSRNPFALGGSSRLRGYPVEFVEGKRVAFATAEYLRPVFRDWLRLMLLADLGWADGDVFSGSNSGVYSSVGMGFRIRPTWFVDVELELGVAVPLRGGEGLRAFGGGGG